MQMSQGWLKFGAEARMAGFSWRSWRLGERCFFGSGPALGYKARDARPGAQPQGESHAKTPSRKELLSDSLASLRETGAPRRSEAKPRSRAAHQDLHHRAAALELPERCAQALQRHRIGDQAVHRQLAGRGDRDGLFYVFRR